MGDRGGRGAAGAANLALKFLLELAAFAALAYTGSQLADGAGAVVLAVVLPLVAVAIWGRWAAPRSPRRLPTAARIPLELVVLLGAAAGLAAVSVPVVAVVLAAAVIVNAVLLTVFRQWDG